MLGVSGVCTKQANLPPAALKTLASQSGSENHCGSITQRLRTHTERTYQREPGDATINRCRCAHLPSKPKLVEPLLLMVGRDLLLVQAPRLELALASSPLLLLVGQDLLHQWQVLLIGFDIVPHPALDLPGGHRDVLADRGLGLLVAEVD